MQMRHRKKLNLNFIRKWENTELKIKSNINLIKNKSECYLPGKLTLKLWGSAVASKRKYKVYSVLIRDQINVSI